VVWRGWVGRGFLVYFGGLACVIGAMYIYIHIYLLTIIIIL